MCVCACVYVYVCCVPTEQLTYIHTYIHTYPAPLFPDYTKDPSVEPCSITLSARAAICSLGLPNAGFQPKARKEKMESDTRGTITRGCDDDTLSALKGEAATNKGGSKTETWMAKHRIGYNGR